MIFNRSRSQKPVLMALSVTGQKLLLQETICRIFRYGTFLDFSSFYNFLEFSSTGDEKAVWVKRDQNLKKQ